MYIKIIHIYLYEKKISTIKFDIMLNFKGSKFG